VVGPPGLEPGTKGL